MRAKLILILLITILGVHTGFAQFSRPLSVGAGAGATFNFTDLSKTKAHPAAYIEADYLFTPFISVGIRAEKGKLSGNEYDSEFSNNYYAGNVNGKVRLGQLLNDPNNYSYKTLTSDIFSTIFSNIYLGAGAGIIKNRISRDISSYYANAIHNKGGGVAKDRYGYHFVVPLNVGLDVPFGRTLYGPKWAINLNYQHTLTTNDNLDGIINGKNDQYGVLSLGIKYALFNK
ncbi:outer membrane beta-barrel protein [Sphingobacterium siyangense]|uniref:outer membrane beta-barrel protein n=1 Tax=Sphingobacterium siyangense TaxID=459529 RepID=UPI002FDD2816